MTDIYTRVTSWSCQLSTASFLRTLIQVSSISYTSLTRVSRSSSTLLSSSSGSSSAARIRAKVIGSSSIASLAFAIALSYYRKLGYSYIARRIV